MKQLRLPQGGIALLLILSVSAFAQPRKRELLWQDMPGSLQKTIVADPVPIRQFTIFQITDINRFLYKVEIKGTAFELETPMPTELEALFRLRPEDLQKRATNKKAEEAVGEVERAILPMEEAKQKTDAGVESLTARIATLASNVGVEKTKLAKIKKSGGKTGTAETELAVAQEELKDAESELVQKEALAATLAEVVEKCKAYLALLHGVAKGVFQLKSARSELVAIAQMDAPFRDISQRAGGVMIPPPTIKDDYMELKEAYEDLEAMYSRAGMLSKETEDGKRITADIKTSLERVEKADELIDQEALVALYTDVSLLQAELRNPVNFNVVAPPVQMDADLVQYTVSITPSPTRQLGVPFRNPQSFTFEVPTSGGLKVDFGVGLVASFGHRAKDQLFYLKEVPGQSVVTLRRRANGNSLTPSVAAMLHAYSRSGRYTGVGGMFGIGAGFQGQESINANLLTGLGFVAGKKQKLMISAGVSFLKVGRLKEDQYRVGNPYDPAKVSLADITEKVYKPSPFLAISYNLSNRVEVK